MQFNYQIQQRVCRKGFLAFYFCKKSLAAHRTHPSRIQSSLDMIVYRNPGSGLCLVSTLTLNLTVCQDHIRP